MLSDLIGAAHQTQVALSGTRSAVDASVSPSDGPGRALSGQPRRQHR